MARFKGGKYLMRVNSLDTEEETGRYMQMEMVFAALNQYTEGIYIKGEVNTNKSSAKEEKKSRIDNPEYGRMKNKEEKEGEDV